MPKKQHSNETKASVLAALLTGQSISEVARQYRIPEGTVKAWKSRQTDVGVATVATTKREEIGDLLLGYLRANLQTLRVQVEEFRDKAWLSKQDAADVAVLHGVLTDKMVRLLEALGGGERNPEREA